MRASASRTAVDPSGRRVSTRNAGGLGKPAPDVCGQCRARRVDEVHVLEHQQQRSGGGGPAHALKDRIEQADPLELRGRRGRSRRALPGLLNPDRQARELGRPGRRWRWWRERARDRVERLRPGCQGRRALEVGGDGAGDQGLGTRACDQLVDEPGLADPGRTGDDRHAPAARARARPRGLEDGQRHRAPHEGAGRRGRWRRLPRSRRWQSRRRTRPGRCARARGSRPTARSRTRPAGSRGSARMRPVPARPRRPRRAARSTGDAWPRRGGRARVHDASRRSHRRVAHPRRPTPRVAAPTRPRASGTRRGPRAPSRR